MIISFLEWFVNTHLPYQTALQCGPWPPQQCTSIASCALTWNTILWCVWIVQYYLNLISAPTQPDSKLASSWHSSSNGKKLLENSDSSVTTSGSLNSNATYNIDTGGVNGTEEVGFKSIPEDSAVDMTSKCLVMFEDRECTRHGHESGTLPS